jgi:hypothetical protein
VFVKPLNQPTFKQQWLELAARPPFPKQTMAALGKDCGVSMPIYKSLLLAFWLMACLLPWLLRGFPYTLKACEVLSGKELPLDSSDKATL